MSSLVDTQNSIDGRNIPINRVGIKDFKLPIQLVTKNGKQNTIAKVSLYTHLEGQYRGTHMSRFISLISEYQRPIDSEAMKELSRDLCQKLAARSSEVILQAPLFVEKAAPITKTSGWVDYDITYHTRYDGHFSQTLEVNVPATSLCPCSKEISTYGAHNQRSIINLSVQYHQPITPEALIDIAEQSASCQLYSILKRPDEKFVTEEAYNNPKFVEDIVRSIYQALLQYPNVVQFKVSSENFESIHNHSAYAEIISSEHESVT